MPSNDSLVKSVCAASKKSNRVVRKALEDGKQINTYIAIFADFVDCVRLGGVGG